jgi:hypothetical protein
MLNYPGLLVFKILNYRLPMNVGWTYWFNLKGQEEGKQDRTSLQTLGYRSAIIPILLAVPYSFLLGKFTLEKQVVLLWRSHVKKMLSLSNTPWDWEASQQPQTWNWKIRLPDLEMTVTLADILPHCEKLSQRIQLAMPRFPTHRNNVIMNILNSRFGESFVMQQ